MEYARLGSTGLVTSRIWLGMMSYGDPSWQEWVRDEDTCAEHVQAALEAGVTTFDTADVYSLGVSEEMTGRVLLARAAREEVVIATKVFGRMREGDRNSQGLSRTHVLDAIDASLRRLGTDHVDLYQIHRFDPDTPVEETMEALHDVVRAGKARYLGASSMQAWQFAKLQHAAVVGGWTPFVSMQNQLSLLYREEQREMLPQCEDMGVGSVPWSPLGRGVLAREWSETGSTERSSTDRFASSTDIFTDDVARAIVDAVGEVAERHGVSRAQVALAWVLRQPAVTAPIVGATRLSHLTDAIGAVDVELSDDDVELLEAPYEPRPVTGHAA